MQRALGSGGVAVLVGAAVLVLVLLRGFGMLDPSSHTARLGGQCDVPEHALDRVISLTTASAVTTAYYDSLSSPAGSTYTVPQRMELVVCSVVSISSATQVGTLEIGYGDDAVSATSTAPGSPVVVASVPAPAVDGSFVVHSVLGRIPAGKIPWVRHTPGVNWSAHAVGLLHKVSH